MKSLADVLGVPDATNPDAVARAASVTAPLVEQVDADTIKDFCISVLSSKEYRDSLQRRILLDELPSAIESLLYHYAIGKPVERHELTGKNGGPIESKVTKIEHVIVDPHDAAIASTTSQLTH